MARHTFYCGCCLATTVAQTLTVTSEFADKEESLSLLYETNAKLCDQIEVFDIIAVNESAEGTRTDTKATTIGQLRRQLEAEDQRLRSQGESKVQIDRTRSQHIVSIPIASIPIAIAANSRDNSRDKSLRLLYSAEEFGGEAQVELVFPVLRSTKLVSNERLCWLIFISIVAVHGLNVDGVADDQHAWDTWIKPAGPSGRCWLRDDLPHHYTPQARILLYKYNSALVFGSPDKDHFVDQGNDLLQSIQNERPKDRNRPLIFIAHNLGGILVQQVSR